MKLTSSIFATVALLAASVMAAPAANSSSSKTYSARSHIDYKPTCVKGDIMFGTRVFSYGTNFELAQKNPNCDQCAKLTVSGKTKYVKFVGNAGCVGCSSTEVSIDPLTLSELFPLTQSIYEGIQIDIVKCGDFDMVGNGNSLKASSK
ncbi:hypothetical protein LPJ73_001698 [Coemansia sp. RSA 2703]|nr:hypothetical protein LPJ73_001698 [Coemansia sp. RSA 2703]KAJ2373915.1 hypothetical protein IW150_003379 [Coemansia sp. RSA 2607]KAJ2396448.1 hypothetical protein GGI05_001110 [Coemansia sp. RSA 2603]